MRLDERPDLVEIPPYILKQVHIIEAPFDEYFILKMPLRYEAILNLPKDNIKLKALEDLNIEARRYFDKYTQEYSSFLELLESWILINKPAYETRAASVSEVYAFFYLKGEVYRYIPSKIERSIEQFKAKIDIEEKYLLRKVDEKATQAKLPLDITKEFKKLFLSPDIEMAFISRLKNHEYITADEKWKGVSTRPGELREAYNVLKALDLLTPGKHRLSSLKIFYKRFGLQPEEPGVKDFFITIKSLGYQGTTKDYELFWDMLKPLTSLKK